MTTFNVTMLDVLRVPFENWLADNDFALASVPDTAPGMFIVVPAPGGWRDRLLDALTNQPVEPTGE